MKCGNPETEGLGGHPGSFTRDGGRTEPLTICNMNLKLSCTVTFRLSKDSLVQVHVVSLIRQDPAQWSPHWCQ